jgi:hypothetical protein
VFQLCDDAEEHLAHALVDCWKHKKIPITDFIISYQDGQLIKDILKTKGINVDISYNNLKNGSKYIKEEYFYTITGDEKFDFEFDMTPDVFAKIKKQLKENKHGFIDKMLDVIANVDDNDLFHVIAKRFGVLDYSPEEFWEAYMYALGKQKLCILYEVFSEFFTRFIRETKCKKWDRAGHRYV